MNSALTNFPDYLKNNIVASWVELEKPAKFDEFSINRSEEIQELLAHIGIQQLYKHQAQSIQAIQAGKNVIISTGTASGKSLCYQLPIISSILEDFESTSLLLFPTKALTSDQMKGFQDLITYVNSHFTKKIGLGIYDGDTTSSRKTTIRNNSRIIFSNPDMLHIGILPHHTLWQSFFARLKYVVIDEAHVYSGVFGSHFVNLLRRLKRIAAFYKSEPQFILSSATVSNPKRLAQTLIEDDVTVFDEDHSPKGRRIFAFYNPPIVNEELGIRKSMFNESIEISKHLLSKKLQTISFVRSRLSVEMLMHKIQNIVGESKYTIAPYRSGYTKSDRRRIENGLKEKKIDLVIATTALELGIDMGMVDGILLNGYPGSITRFIQQAGRAGRKNNESYCLLVASALPIDQYIINHPGFIRNNKPEEIFLNPNNPFILFNHIQSAAFELPFAKRDLFGDLSTSELSNYLEILEQIKKIMLDDGKYYWVSSAYPASEISLRSIGGSPTQIYSVKNSSRNHLGEVDRSSVKKFLHPGAIYMHMGLPYHVDRLDLVDNYVELSPDKNSLFYTKPQIDIDAKIIQIDKVNGCENWRLGFGDVKITEHVTGFRKVTWETMIELGREELDLEPDVLETRGGWMQFTERLIDQMNDNNLWSLSAIDYGRDWKSIRKKVILRDSYTCQLCAVRKDSGALHVHHKTPVRQFPSPKEAHSPENLITLCQNCHRIAERNLHIGGTLSGLGFSLLNIAPLFVKCDQSDIGITSDMKIETSINLPGLIFYDQFPGGLGLSEIIYNSMPEILSAILDQINSCPCSDGCPSCVGPGGENGFGAKKGVKKLLENVLNENCG